MSAWVVSRAHIDALVLAGVQFGVLDRPTPGSLTDLGAGLWAENVRSVKHLYDEDDQPEPYTVAIAEVVLDPVAVVKLVDCYVYQSCEHPGWAGSAAAGYCRRLRATVMGVLQHGDEDQPGPGGQADPEEQAYPAGWDDAPWGISRLVDAAVTASARGTSTVDAAGRASRRDSR